MKGEGETVSVKKGQEEDKEESGQKRDERKKERERKGERLSVTLSGAVFDTLARVISAYSTTSESPLTCQ